MLCSSAFPPLQPYKTAWLYHSITTRPLDTQRPQCTLGKDSPLYQSMCYIIFHRHLCFHLDTFKSRLLVSSDSDGDFMMVRSTTTGHESYIPTSYTAKVAHRYVTATKTHLKCVCILCMRMSVCVRSCACMRRRAGSSLTGGSSFCVCELYLSGDWCLEQDLCSLQWHISLCLLHFHLLLQWGMCSDTVTVGFPDLKTTWRYCFFVSFCLHESTLFYCPTHLNVTYCTSSALSSGGCSQASAGTKPWSCSCNPITRTDPSWSVSQRRSEVRSFPSLTQK